MQYISILDYSTGNNLIIEDEDDLTKGLQDYDIEALLSALGFHMSNCNWMQTEEDPGQSRTTLRELEDEHYEEVEKLCIERNLSAEDNGE